MSRTDKQGIRNKKQRQHKQSIVLKGSKRFDYPKRRLDIDEAKSLGIIVTYTNPKGNTYNRYMKGRKNCVDTGVRVDPDGYRYIRTPSGSSEIVSVNMSGWVRSKMKRNGKGM